MFSECKSLINFRIVFLLLCSVQFYAQEVVWENAAEGDTIAIEDIEQEKLKNGFPRAFLEFNYLAGSYILSSNASYLGENFRENGFDLRVKIPFLFHRLKPKLKASLMANGSYRLVNFSYKRSETVIVNFFDRNEIFFSLGYGLIIGPEVGLKFMIEPLVGFQFSNSLEAIDVTFDGKDLQEDYFLLEDPEKLKFYQGIFFKMFLEKSTLFNRRKEGLSKSMPLAINFGITHHDNPTIFTNSKYAEVVTLVDGTTFRYPKDLFYFHLGLSCMF